MHCDATVGFAFPRLVWATYIGYSLIALLLTQAMWGAATLRTGVMRCIGVWG